MWRLSSSNPTLHDDIHITLEFDWRQWDWSQPRECGRTLPVPLLLFLSIFNSQQLPSVQLLYSSSTCQTCEIHNPRWKASLSIPFLRGICISFFALSRFDCEWNQCKMYGLFSCVKFTSEPATILFCKTWLWLATTTKEIQGKGSVTGTSENARNVQKQGDVDRNTWKNRAELRSFWTFWIRKRTT